MAFKDPERGREYSRQWRAANRDRQREASRRWVQANPEHARRLNTERKRRARAVAAIAVFSHYGTVCACCGTAEQLTIDHVNGDGRQHRQEIGNMNLHRWLIANGFPDGFQTLCGRCNRSKGNGLRCQMHYERTAL